MQVHSFTRCVKNYAYKHKTLLTQIFAYEEFWVVFKNTVYLLTYFYELHNIVKHYTMILAYIASYNKILHFNIHVETLQ